MTRAGFYARMVAFRAAQEVVIVSFLGLSRWFAWLDRHCVVRHRVR